MSKYIPGREVLTRLVIRDFELFYDYVKKELLQPYSQGRPKPPPDISYKLYRKEELYKELDLLKIRYPILTRPREEMISLAQKDPNAVGLEIIHSKLPFSEYKYLEKEAKNLEEELSQIDDIYSWKNYDLPDSETQAKRVLKDLVDSLFLEEEVLKINRLIKGPPQKTVTRAPMPTKSVSGMVVSHFPAEKPTLEDVKKLPKKTPELPRRIDGNDLMKRWNKRDFELIAYVKERGLNVYSPSCDPIPKNSPYPLIINEYSIFDLSEVEEFEKKYPELLTVEVSKPQIKGDKKVSKKLTDLKLKKEEHLKDPVLMELLKKAKPEMEFLYNELQEFAGFQYNNNPDREKNLQEEAESMLADPNNKFEYLKKEYFKDKKIYSTDPKQIPRDFIGPLLKKIVKDQLRKRIGGQILYEIYKEI